jgi:NAD(P)-dependent dehydrogenase (short-subunit alcohol dehydrogenase family)
MLASVAACHDRFNTPRISGSGHKDAMIAGLIEQTPLGRMADPDDIADVSLFLASDDSRSMTGSEIFADGGIARV